ncbi:MAG: hypothetical protein RL291_1041 [Pseudomonadota bacterium]|jgi:hypothetical protein
MAARRFWAAFSGKQEGLTMPRSTILKCLAIAALTAPLAACAAQVEPSGLGGPRQATAVEGSVEPAQYRGREGTVVVAESRYGHGRVSGPVRQNARGRLEVRAPGGTWFECAQSCSETLRRETVDFWENKNRNGPDGPAYLRWSR